MSKSGRFKDLDVEGIKKDLKSADIIPRPEDLRFTLLDILNVEIARFKNKQKKTDSHTGLTGSKQIHELIKSVGALEDQQYKQEGRDALSSMTDQERLSVLKQVIIDLPPEEKQALFQSLLGDGNDKE